MIEIMIPPFKTANQVFEKEDLKKSPSKYEEMLRRAEQKSPFYHIDPNLVALAAEISSFAIRLSEEEKCALTMVCLTLLIDLSKGSTRTISTGKEAYHHFRGIYQQLLGSYASPILVLTEKILTENKAPEVIGTHPNAYTPIISYQGYLYIHKILHAEKSLTKLLFKRLKDTAQRDPHQLDFILEDIQQRPALLKNGVAIVLNQEQNKALKQALMRRISLISGGPGTGKTSIVVALLRALIRLGLNPERIALAAPTGKAAWRMGESVNLGLQEIKNASEKDEYLKNHPPIPQTIHRLLNYHPIEDRFKRHHQHPIEADVLIVDESSMIDLFLMERLLNALPTNAQVIFLGDADQLPSVSAGAVFRDILKLASHSTSTLTQSHRMRKEDPFGLAILSVAQEIKEGIGICDEQGMVISQWIKQSNTVKEVDDLGVWCLKQTQKDQYEFLNQWFDRYIKSLNIQHKIWHFEDGKLISQENEALSMIFDRFAQARILCLTQNLDTGVIKINARLHGRYSRLIDVDAPFLVGEPVMMLFNDYDRMLFNGDQGIVLWAKPFHQEDVSPRLMVAFPEIGGGFKIFDMDSLTGRIEHCYAMTVHKSQGSEFNCVAIVLPEKTMPLLTRELIYTAVTRAKKGVIFLGNSALLSTKELLSLERSSALQDFMQELSAEFD
jgi:exodeoxyribonuclease V alpha subunit